jgi:methionyl-tRNA synthetase
VEASKVEKSDKLLLLKLKVGACEKQVVAGIALHYEPSALIGKKLVIVNNLKAVKLRGVMSQGMILAASNDESLCFITPEKDIDSGAKVK